MPRNRSRPKRRAGASRHARIVGSKAAELAALAGAEGEAIALLPDARSLGLLDPAHLTADLGPIYGRPPDAALPGERR